MLYCSGWDHPRACGEQCSKSRRETTGGGSPPRVRGTAGDCCSWCYGCRITPARAGNRQNEYRGVTVGKDHPRACGEQSVWKMKSRASRGSPPRVRGTASHSRSVAPPPGITPARAGNRPTPAARQPRSQDHPRACGEQTASKHDPRLARGSPPRVRGTEVFSRLLNLPQRITPARAGNRALFLCLRHAIKDHPRACGEQVCQAKFYYVR